MYCRSLTPMRLDQKPEAVKSRNRLKKLTFQMLFNEKGYSFPTDNKLLRINKLEMFWDGKMYDVKLQLAD